MGCASSNSSSIDLSNSNKTKDSGRKKHIISEKNEQIMLTLNEKLKGNDISSDIYKTTLLRLEKKDSTLTEIKLNNIITISQSNSNWVRFAAALMNNIYITDIELCNIKMKDEHCEILLPAFASCTRLHRLSVETNELTGSSIIAIAYMAEKHPTITELHIANQHRSVGIEAERQLANVLSHNLNIIRVSHAFVEKYVEVFVSKYISRNLDIGRQKRLLSSPKSTFTVEVDPYPFPRQGLADEDNVPMTIEVSRHINTNSNALKGSHKHSSTQQAALAVSRFDFITKNDLQIIIEKLENKDPNITGKQLIYYMIYKNMYTLLYSIFYIRLCICV